MGTIGVIMLLFSLMSAAAQIGTNYKINQENLANQQGLMNSQYNYSEQAAENANRRTEELYYNISSPEARMNQLKEAGLSPGLFYGGSGGTIGNAVQAAQATTPSIPLAQMNPIMNGNMMENILSSLRTTSENEKRSQEIKNLKQQVYESQAEISKMAEETQNLKIERRTKELNNELLELQKQFEIATQPAKIDIIWQTLNKLNSDIEKNLREIEILDIEKSKKEEMMQAVIDNYNAQTKLFGKQMILTMAQTTTEKAKQLLMASETEVNHEMKEKIRKELPKVEAETEKILTDTAVENYTLDAYKRGQYYLTNEKGYGKIIGAIADLSRNISAALERDNPFNGKNQKIGLDGSNFHGLGGQYSPLITPVY